MSKLTALDVIYFYPNIIGYIRIISMLISFYTAHDSWVYFTSFYGLAFIGDVVDGFIARRFNQTSSFGGVLDMVTDRVSTCGLLTILSQLYASYSFYFMVLISLDIFSHWFHVMRLIIYLTMHLTVLSVIYSVSGHHKSKESLQHRNSLLIWYYSIYPLFAYCCVGTEVFYILLFILHHQPNAIILHQICWYGCFPGCVFKQVINVAQLMSAGYTIANIDADNSNNKAA